MTKTDPFELFKAMNPYRDEPDDSPDEDLLARITAQPGAAAGRRAARSRSPRHVPVASDATPIEPHVEPTLDPDDASAADVVAMQGAARSDNRTWLAVAAAAIALAGLGGVVALRDLSSPAPTATSQQSVVPAPAPTVIPAPASAPPDASGSTPASVIPAPTLAPPDASGSTPASVIPAPTLAPPDASGPTPATVLAPTEDMSVGGVLCVDAGATQRAVILCTEEFGGDAIEAAAVRTESFVMPVDPANPSHVASTAHLGEDFNLPVRDLDAALLPAGMDQQNPASTTYLVVGSSDDPYAP